MNKKIKLCLLLIPIILSLLIIYIFFYIGFAKPIYSFIGLFGVQLIGLYIIIFFIVYCKKEYKKYLIPVILFLFLIFSYFYYENEYYDNVLTFMDEVPEYIQYELFFKTKTNDVDVLNIDIIDVGNSFEVNNFKKEIIVNNKEILIKLATDCCSPFKVEEIKRKESKIEILLTEFGKTTCQCGELYREIKIKLNKEIDLNDIKVYHKKEYLNITKNINSL